MLDLLFEISWEVCNKVGGIYTVLSTKARTLQQKHKDRVLFIGPDLWSKDKESPFFTESASLLADWKATTKFPGGMSVRVGRWNVPGSPIAILVNYRPLFAYKNELYAKMWDLFRVDSLHAYGDYDESCMFAYGAALVIERIVKWRQGKARRVVAHFDEWMTGMGLLYVKAQLPSVGTVFTTHATSIGRSICGNGKPLYDYLAGYNGDQMACELNMQSKHSLEKTAAQQADSFTTVSEVTAREALQLLERQPLVTPNAFEQRFVPKGDQFNKAREEARACLLQVARSLTGEDFGPDTLLVCTSGRSEWRNKGIDVVFDALNMTRHQLNQLSSLDRKIIALVMVPAWTDSARTDLQQAVARKATMSLFNPVITHTIHRPHTDCIYNRINALGLHNELSDSVKVIYVPSYLNGNDGIFNKTYYDLLIGMDLSIFPSYYEPWGYTPLESIAFGVPAITTDLAGFGQWVLNEFGSGLAKSGVEVILRTDSNYGETVAAVSKWMSNALMMTPAQMRRCRKAAQRTARAATWEYFMPYYEVAYAQAMQRVESRQLAMADELMDDQPESSSESSESSESIYQSLR